MKTGIEIISEERQRQILVEGWTYEHDDRHFKGDLAAAANEYVFYAACQSALKEDIIKNYIPAYWPWETELWKPSDNPIRNLAKAGALIAAEIDRLQRLKEK